MMKGLRLGLLLALALPGVARLSITCSRARSSGILTGLTRKSSGPMPTSFSRPLSKALAETMAHCTSRSFIWRTRRSVSQPSMPGIAKSMKTACGR